jgi:hypothetical protein
MALPSQRVRDTAVARLEVAARADTRQWACPARAAVPRPGNDSLFARLCMPAQVLPAAVDYGHFTRVEAAGTAHWGWIDQRAKADLERPDDSP